MDRPPRPRKERLLSAALLARAYLFLGPIEAASAVGGFFLYLFSQGWEWGAPLPWTSTLYRQATTVTLAGIVLAQVANVFACRSDRTSVLSLGLLANPWIPWGILVELALLVSIVYTPLLNEVFGTGPLPAWIFGPLLLGALFLLVADEIRKFFAGRFFGPARLARSEAAGAACPRGRGNLASGRPLQPGPCQIRYRSRSWVNCPR